MADEWPTVRLGDVAELVTGFPFKSDQYSGEPSSPRLLRGDNIAQGWIRWDRAKRWPIDATTAYGAHWLKEGDVVLAMDRPWIEAGLKYATVGPADLPALLVQRVARLRGTRDLDTRFLRYVIGSRAFTNHVLAVQTGTAVPHISGGQIRGFEFALPPLAQQAAIASMLGALDDKIELNQLILESCRELAKIGLQTAAIGAPAVRIGDVATVERGLAYTSTGLADHGTPMVNLGSAANYGWLKRFRSGFKWYVGPHKHRHAVGPWGLLVTSVEQTWSNEILGWPLLVPEDAGRVLFSQDLYAVRFRPGEEWRNIPVWAGMFLPDSRAWLEAHIYGSTVARIPRESLEELRVPCPDAGHPAIVLGSESLLRRAWAAEVESRSLAAVRDALLPKLISGEVRVASPEHVLQGAPI